MSRDYTIIRSVRKTLAIEITKDLKLLVRAPKRASSREIEDMLVRHQPWIEKHLEIQRQRALTRPEPTPEEIAVFRRQAKAILPERVRHYGALMELTPTRITITSAEKRFGSCSGKNSIAFSWRLMRYPEAAIDYVVVHELAHIRHKNHGKAFYALIESVLPDYKARQKLLKG